MFKKLCLMSLISILTIQAKIDISDEEEVFKADFESIMGCKNPKSEECKKAAEEFSEFFIAYKSCFGRFYNAKFTDQAYFKEIVEKALPNVPAHKREVLLKQVMRQSWFTYDANKKELMEFFLKEYLKEKKCNENLTLKNFIGSKVVARVWFEGIIETPLAAKLYREMKNNA